ncbi:MAG TPA: hypothetical protein PLY73_14295 [Candidatus Ozemobacteraceae bacterium]|nr:hypothetical protein [Candidatus Ozemobacteraceae bacterium]
MNPDMNAVIADWREAAGRHRKWMLLCLAAAVILEIWFFRHPPRGYEATDVVTVGEAAGEPLIGFAKVWDRLINDDAFMTDVMALGWGPASEPRDKILRRLNLEVRPGMSFRMFSPGMAEIKFTQGTYEGVRPFLTAFTKRLLEHLRIYSAREFEKRRYRLGVNVEALSRKRIALQNMFGTGALVTSGFEPEDQEFRPDPERVSVADLASSSFLGLAGMLMIDTARLQEAVTMQAWKELTATETQPLVLAPREPTLLTDPASPARLVQPLVGLLHLFIPIAFFFLFLAGMTFFESAGDDERSAAGRAGD